MRTTSLAVLTGPILASLVACSPNNTSDVAQDEAVNAPEIIGESTLTLANGKSVGTVALRNSGESLSLDIALQGLEPGERALHLHRAGQCDAPEFTSAGGHLNPYEKSHGSLSEGGKHLGDLANIVIAADGTYSGTADLEGVPAELMSVLFDQDGTAVMIHAGADDYKSDPAGAAGPRIACGVLNKA